MRAVRLLAALGLAIALSGCTTYVTVSSDPEGALITSADGAETYGRAPLDIPFDRSALEERLGKVPGFVATWPSGAQAATESPYEVRDLRYGAKIELRRPQDVPGVEEDLRFALRRAQQRAEEAEAERARMELYWRDGWMRGPWMMPPPVFYRVR